MCPKHRNVHREIPVAAAITTCDGVCSLLKWHGPGRRTRSGPFNFQILQWCPRRPLKNERRSSRSAGPGWSDGGRWTAEAAVSRRRAERPRELGRVSFGAMTGWESWSAASFRSSKAERSADNRKTLERYHPEGPTYGMSKSEGQIPNWCRNVRRPNPHSAFGLRHSSFVIRHFLLLPRCNRSARLPAKEKARGASPRGSTSFVPDCEAAPAPGLSCRAQPVRVRPGTPVSCWP